MSEQNTTRLMFVGDISLGEYYTSFGHGPRTFAKKRSPFEQVAALFEQADMVVANLEASLTNANLQPAEPESMVLRGDPADAILLQKANFRVLQVANNHTVQHGKAGFDETVSALTKAGIAAIGINRQKVHVVNVKGVSLGFLAASDVPDNTDKAQQSYQRFDDEFKNVVRDAVKSVDHLFVLLHWGLESSTKPMDYQRNYASELAELGVRGVIGQHPHLFYPIWQEKNTVIAPSLGNFVFDLCWDKRLTNSGILDVTIDGDELSWKVWPAELTENGALPLVSGDPIFPESANRKVVKLYDLGSNMSGEQKRKLSYFFKHLHKGNLLLKLKFIIRKFFPFLKPRITTQ